MARSVKDAVTILQIIAGKEDNHNTKAEPISSPPIPDYLASCQPLERGSLRLGVPRYEFNNLLPAVQRSFDDVVMSLREIGVEVIEIEYKGTDLYRSLTFEQHLCTMITEFRESIDSYLSGLIENPNSLCSLEGLAKVTLDDPREGAPTRDIEMWQLALKSNPNSEEYKAGRQRGEYFGGAGGIGGAMEEYCLDAIISPAGAKMSNHLAAAGGLPSISVPLGFMPSGTPVEWSKEKDLIIQAPNRP
jgi:amidase